MEKAGSARRPRAKRIRRAAAILDRTGTLVLRAAPEMPNLPALQCVLDLNAALLMFRDQVRALGPS